MIIVSLMLIIACGIAAQTDNSSVGFGLHFGTVSGNGYAMRWMGEDLGLQLTIGAMTSGSNNVKFYTTYYPDDEEFGSVITVDKKGRDRSLNGAINVLYMLDHFKKGRLYLAGGFSYTNYKKHVVSMDYRYEQYNYYTLIEDSRREEDVLEHQWTAGIGPGIELGISSHFRLAFEVPVTYDYKDDIVMYLPQIGFYYYFK